MLRAKLRARAAELLSEHGVSGLSLRTLASEVGTSTTAVYALFGGKPGLIKTLVDDAFRRLRRTLDDVPADPDPAARLVALGEAYRTDALCDPHLYDAMFGGEHLDAESRELQEEAFEPLVSAVEAAVGAKVLRHDADPGTVALGLWSALHGLVSIQLHAHTPREVEDPATAARAVLRAAVDGWRPLPHPRVPHPRRASRTPRPASRTRQPAARHRDPASPTPQRASPTTTRESDTTARESDTTARKSDTTPRRARPASESGRATASPPPSTRESDLAAHESDRTAHESHMDGRPAESYRPPASPHPDTRVRLTTHESEPTVRDPSRQHASPPLPTRETGWRVSRTRRGTGRIR